MSFQPKAMNFSEYLTEEMKTQKLQIYGVELAVILDSQSFYKPGKS